MYIRTAERYLKEEYDIEFPEGREIPGSWFKEHHLPMIVECAACGASMTLPSAYIDREGYTYCPSCAGH